MKLIRETSCCFTGHRIIPERDRLWLRKQLREEMNSLIEAGVDTFLSGGAVGFDTLAAQEVLALRDGGAPIHLVLALPCLGQERRWPKKDAELYHRLIDRSDETIYTGDVYTESCMFERNRYLVDHSAHCLCYLTHTVRSGTAYTVRYARSQGVKVVNLAGDQLSLPSFPDLFAGGE